MAIPILFYIKNFYSPDPSSSPSDWGTFGDYVGGILNPFISLLTLIATIGIAIYISKIEKRNHEETVHSPVKPLITMKTEDFFSSDISRNGLTVEQDFYGYKPPKAPAGPHEHLFKRFYLKILNKGLGIATDVNVTFEIELDKLKPLLMVEDPKITVTVGDIKIDEEGRNFMMLSIKSTHYNYHGFFFKILSKEATSLGVIDKGKKGKATVPSQFMDAFQLFNLINKVKSTDREFPPFVLNVKYKNMYSKELETTFKVGFLHLQDLAYYSRFRLVQEEILIENKTSGLLQGHELRHGFAKRIADIAKKVRSKFRKR